MRQAALALLLFCAACSFGPARSDRAVTAYEGCMKSCDRDFDLCMDESSNSREVMQGLGRAPAAGTGCQSDLKACQQGRCRGL